MNKKKNIVDDYDFLTKYICDIYNLIISLQGEIELDESDNNFLEEVKKLLIDNNVIQDRSRKK